MERFVCDLIWIRRISIVSATATGAAIYFLGVPFAVLFIVGLAETVALNLAQDWYRKHGHRD